jgi:CDP-6-deoxy-D-xylo-4-hexulose-3-dehydrase
MSAEIRDKINKFIDELKGEYGVLPRFAHNLRPFNNQVLYSGFYWDNNELAAALESLIFSEWSISGEAVVRFENEFSKKINIDYSLMTNSGSSSNLVMFAAAKDYFNWGENDEIICSVCAFPTSVSVIYQNRLKPVFVDISMEDLNMDLDQIESKITHKTKAILFAPTLGNCCDVDRLVEIAKKHHLVLLLDNCDGIGTKWRGKYLNEYFFASTCSFFASHHLSCIQAGMISSSTKEFIEICRQFVMWSRNCRCRGLQNLLPNGMCKKRFSNWIEELPDVTIDDKYYFTKMGYNLQPLEFQGAIGLEQLKKFDEIHTKRKNHHKIIQDLLKKYIPSLKFPIERAESDTSWFGVGIICENHEQKKRLVNYLEIQNKVQCRNFFSGNLLLHPGYKFLGDFREFPNSTEVIRSVLFLGCAPHYEENEELDYLEKVLKQYGEI